MIDVSVSTTWAPHPPIRAPSLAAAARPVATETWVWDWWSRNPCRTQKRCWKIKSDPGIVEVPISFTAVTVYLKAFEGHFRRDGKGTVETYPFHVSFKTLDLHPSACALGLHFLQLCQAMLVEQEDVRKPSRSYNCIHLWRMTDSGLPDPG